MPFGLTSGSNPTLAVLVQDATGAPAKHVLFTNGATAQTVETRATSVATFLRERGIDVQAADAISPALDAPIADDDKIVYRAAVPIDLDVDGRRQHLDSAAPNVRSVLRLAHVAVGRNDRVEPALDAAIAGATTIRVTHATSWLERFRSVIPAPILRKFDIGMAPGSQRVIDPGRAGSKETTVVVLQPAPTAAAQRLFLAARVLRFPRARVVAEGVGDYSSLANIARRGMASTARLADAALKMVATAYTAACSGCTGLTASGHPAGHGIVAVDPHLIPLGTHLFIPGYGHALAGDTGGSIRGNRIDLGFDSSRDAMSFGRRAVVVYVLK